MVILLGQNPVRSHVALHTPAGPVAFTKLSVKTFATTRQGLLLLREGP
jgi:hypothetical protein